MRRATVAVTPILKPIATAYSRVNSDSVRANRRHGIGAQMGHPIDINDGKDALHAHLEHHGNGQHDDRAADWSFGVVAVAAAKRLADRAPQTLRIAGGFRISRRV